MVNTDSATARDNDVAAAGAARWLTAAVSGVVMVTSAVGLLWSGMYQDSEAVQAMFRGFDLVTLTIVGPVLAGSLLPVWRDRPAVLLVRASMLAYCVYNFAYYLFGAELNAGLLAHVVIVPTSLWALVLVLRSAPVGALADHFRDRTPVRSAATILLLLGIPLAFIQVSGLLGFALRGAMPPEPSHLIVPLTITRLGAVLDLTILVPLYVLAAVWLWQRRSWGYVLATVALVAGALHQISYMAAMAFQIMADTPRASFDPYEPFILGLFVIGSTLLLSNLRPQRTAGHTAAPRRSGALKGA